jgi:phosphotransferase system HPr-like phosphotransfer protein
MGSFPEAPLDRLHCGIATDLVHIMSLAIDINEGLLVAITTAEAKQAL